MSLFYETIFVATICCTNLLSLAALGNTIVILPYIGDDFGVTKSPGQLTWAVAAYSLTVGTFILPAGKWGDLLGHKRMLCFGYLWFAVWSLVTGFSRWVLSTLVHLHACAVVGGKLVCEEILPEQRLGTLRSCNFLF